MIVTFQPPDALVLREAAQILSDRQERVDERIEGYVSALARDQSEPEGRATIKAVIDGALTSVKADFSPFEYSRITKAHDNGGACRSKATCGARGTVGICRTRAI